MVKIIKEEYDDFGESCVRNRNRAIKSGLREFYRYNYDNQKIIDLLCKIEDTGDTRKIDRAYDFVNRSCDNIDDCTEGGWYDLSDASWGFGTDYIIEELTDILNESVRRGIRRMTEMKKSIELSDDEEEELFNIIDQYNTSIPVSGSWNTETTHELKTIADYFNISLQDAKQVMIDYLGFEEDMFNESIRRVSRRKLHEDIDWTEDINEVLNANKEYIEKIVYTDDWDVTNWEPEVKDKVRGKIRIRNASKDRAVWQYLGYTKWDDDVLVINDKKEADSLSELFDYIADFPVNRKKPSWKVRVFLPKQFNKR